MNNPRDLSRYVLDFLFPFTDVRGEIETMSESSFLNSVEQNGVYLPESLHATFRYKDRLVRAAVRALKYNGSKHAALLLASGMNEHVMGAIEDLMAFEERNIVFIPVPISKQRLKERGFNQAEILTQHISSYFPDTRIPIITNTVTKTKDSPSQTRLKRKERFRNMHGAFCITDPKKVRSKNIIVIDDVITTGATCSEIRKTLLREGASSVSCFAAAH